MLPATTRPPGRRLLGEVAAALFHLGVDIVLYGYLAVAWVHSLGGTAVEILGRWVYGKGSAAESVGAAVQAACWVVLARFFLAFVPLFVMRQIERFKYDEEEERREKLASTEQLPKSKEEQLGLPKGCSLVPIFMFAPLCQLLHLAMLMKCSGEGSRLWNVGSVLYDVASFGLAVNAGLFVQNIMIIVTVPKVQERNGMMQ